MSSYIIRESSPILWIISAILTTFIGFTLVILIAINKLIPDGQSWLIVLIILPFIILAFKVPRYTATADIKITIDEVGIKKEWVKQLLFHNRPDIEVKWIDIQDFVFEPDRQFDKFKITLKDGSKFKFFHNNDYNDKDDFLKFLNDFEFKVEKINSDQNQLNDIKRGKTIYETIWGLILGILAIIMLLAIPIMLIAFPIKKSPNYALLGVSYIGAIYFLFQLYNHRRKKK